jgi:tRNA (adenine22-N1)-methyltransferase
MNTEQKHPPLDQRLALAASFIRPGSVICDVGTDHAYLPIWLLTHGVCSRAVACDINEGPLQSAREHAARFGCTERMSFYRADGLNGIDLEKEQVSDIVICGMGGELIARILAEAEYSRKKGIRAVLQPMSSVEDLRASLAKDGYRIEDERLAFAACRVYTCLSVIWDGVQRTFTPAELLVGQAHIRRGKAAGELFCAHLTRHIQSLEKRKSGLECGGYDASAEKELLREMYAIAEKEGVSI